MKSQLVMAVYCKRYEEFVGMSRLYDMNEKHKRISLGYTWLRKKNQRDGTNRNSKFLICRFVFEGLEAERLHFDIDEDNWQSRDNVAGIGAKLDGILRNNSVCVDVKNSSEGQVVYRRRNTAIYSIVRQEWPGTRKGVLGSCSE